MKSNQDIQNEIFDAINEAVLKKYGVNAWGHYCWEIEETRFFVGGISVGNVWRGPSVTFRAYFTLTHRDKSAHTFHKSIEVDPEKTDGIIDSINAACLKIRDRLISENEIIQEKIRQQKKSIEISAENKEKVKSYLTDNFILVNDGRDLYSKLRPVFSDFSIFGIEFIDKSITFQIRTESMDAAMCILDALIARDGNSA